jgi:hypothetical protein
MLRICTAIATFRGCRAWIAIPFWAAAIGAQAASAASNNVTPTAQTAPTSHTLQLAGVTVHVDFRDTDLVGGVAPIMNWIERSIGIVAGYYGRFPVARLDIRVLPVSGRGVQGGTTFGAPEALIRTRVGREVTEGQLLNDWVLVHEMVHLALPEVGESHAWLSEGLATYVESIARVQAGYRAPADVWAELERAMPQGLPQPGDQGLDRTHTCGRTYWGGAIFCLLADVEIRSRSDSRVGLQNALRAIAKKSGGLVTDWPIDRVLATGDAAVGMRVLQDLYEQMKETPVAPDLPQLWKRLGVQRDAGQFELRDDAPLAAVRKAIMQRQEAGVNERPD